MLAFPLHLNPTAIEFGFIQVTWYGIILGLGALVGLVLAVIEGKRFGISSDFFMDLLLIGVPSAIVGARLYYVVFSWANYKDNFWDVFKIWEGGIAIHGALIGAFIGGYFYIRHKGYNFWRIADICAPSLIVGQMIGRWGNFMNQEAYGGPVSEEFLRNSLHLPNFIVEQMYINELFRHPTFLYESLWNLLGLVLLVVIRRFRWVRAGEVLFGYLIWYSIGRFYIEGLRTDSLAFDGPGWLVTLMDSIWAPMTWFGFEQGEMFYGTVRSAQLIGIFIVLAAIIFIWIRRRQGESLPKYSDPILSTKTVTKEG